MSEAAADCSCKANLGLAVQTSGMGIWQMSVEREICLDARGSEIHGLEPVAGQIRSISEFLGLVHVGDRDKLEAVLSRRNAEEFHDLEYRLSGSEQQNRWVRLSGGVRNNSDDQVVSLVGGCFDISESMVMHRQLLQAQKMEAVGQLTAGIAHNFNNILSAILPSLHLVTPYVKPEGAKLVRNALLAAERATDLISELMVVAGRKGGQAHKSLNLVATVERVVRICRTTFGGWVQLHFDSDFAFPPILGNESQVEQVLLNLLLNARDAFEETTTSCPRIDLILDEEGEQLVLRVIDNGPGMDAKTAQRIFEPFFTTKASGTGLGLATAYAIVGDHGGSIQCWSKPGQGTEFEICFPRHEGHEASCATPNPLDVAPIVGGSERILVVDDDVLVRRVTSSVLREAGYEVLEAKGGDEAIVAQANGDAFDLVVLDMAMPELTGDQVLETMRSKDPRVRVLIFTGLSDVRVEKLRGVAVLQKPAGINALLQAVRGAIDNRAIH